MKNSSTKQTDIDEVFYKMPYKWEKWGNGTDKGKDTVDMVDAMQKGHYIDD